ncbi:MAG TPA: ChbG/HpnK family deacetylase [Bacteroidota bacterium]|nr:ChbG/HpnK family deacetylase [Bacteroidota bacterium]
MKMIVNADDYGITTAVNEAIALSFKLGMIDRTTAIANAPYFDDGCALAIACGFATRVGVHFNLTRGPALSPMMADTPCFCNTEGMFIYRRNTRRFITRSEKEAVADECEHQIRRFYEAGLSPVHLDSHHHVHTEWSIFNAIEPVLRRNGITSVRISKNIGPSTLMRMTYKSLFNLYLDFLRIRATRYFGEYTEILPSAQAFAPETLVEVMTHPVFDSQGVIVDARSARPLEEGISVLRSSLPINRIQ